MSVKIACAQRRNPISHLPSPGGARLMRPLTDPRLGHAPGAETPGDAGSTHARTHTSRLPCTPQRELEDAPGAGPSPHPA